jgi:hypothetical protein
MARTELDKNHADGDEKTFDAGPARQRQASGFS